MIVGYGVGSGITDVVGVSDGEIVGDPVTGASVGEAEGDLVGSAVTTTGAREAEGRSPAFGFAGFSALCFLRLRLSAV